jgi:hypothetical protein
MVIVPARCGPVFAATENWVTPLPLPLAPEVIVIHVALLVAVHAQPVKAVTFTLPVPPLAMKLWVVGLMVNKQPELWVTVKVLPPMVNVPVRCGPVFAATENCVTPSPLPLAPEVMVIHVALLAAVHAQPVAVVTLTEPDPPLAGTLCEVGLRVNEQPELCVTVNVWPAMVNVPVRCGPVLAATENCVEPLPVPLAPVVIVIQVALLAPVQAQSLAVVTLTEPPPPLAVKF